MSNEMANDAGLLREYLVECEELLQQLDQDLVALESAPASADLLNRIFRAVHTIKGTSGFMGFTPIVGLAHHAEDVLNLLRKGERKFTRRVMDLLLRSLDNFRHMMRDVRAGGLQTYALEDLFSALKALAQGQPEPDRPRLGEIMVVQNVINHQELSASLAEASQSVPPKKLGEVLVEKQLATENQVKEALDRQAGAPGARDSARTLRVDVAKIDDLVNLVGELVLERNRLLQLSRDFSAQAIPAEKFEAALTHSAARLSFITGELQTASLKTRMVPIDMVFRKFPRLVRDIARNLGKDVELLISGEHTELDKTVVEEIGDPLVHLVRNALDHAIEPAAVRLARGKPAAGVIRLSAQQEGEYIVISVSDDGAGIDPQRIVRKALEKGLVTEERLRSMTPQEILDLIFLPGFSTVEKVSDLSGRGVGMDVVRTNLKKLNGVATLESAVGVGTTVTLRLPLTLAILPALLVRVAEETYVLPLHSVVETLRVRPIEVHRIEDREVLRVRDSVIPLVRLRERFRLQQTQDGDGKGFLCVVIVVVGQRRIGLIVDQLLGQEETVIKPLDGSVGHIPGLAGATIGGDGRVRLILDPTAIARNRDEVHA